ncbi:mannosyl-oligosaccharide glucosidase GCS1-like [Nymphaea colorata]|nr:mannosyl-oligosaccharide glucosidase GCS1-like [Nymphaea colorata]
MGGGSRTSARSRGRVPDLSSRHSDGDPRPRKGGRARRSPGLLNLLEFNLKIVLGFGIVAFSLIGLVIYRQLRADESVQVPRCVTPLPAPKMTELPQFQGDHRESLYWGTYRPHVYLGIRARTPRSLIAGLMWIGVKDGRYHLRHICQDSDDLSTYGWTKHNGRDYGHQVLVDQDLIIATSFVKAHASGSGYGGDWAVRVEAQYNGSSLTEMPFENFHLFFYLADEEEHAVNIDKLLTGYSRAARLSSGSREDVGMWELHINPHDSAEIHHAGFKTSHFHNLTELVQAALAVEARRMGRLQLFDMSEDSSNVAIFQISAKLPLKMDLVFLSGTVSEISRVEDRVSSLTGTHLTTLLHKKDDEFEDKYQICFNLSDKMDLKARTAGKAAISNMLGGIGYFYGQSEIAFSNEHAHSSSASFIPYWPAALYTAVPSRSFFPRGFLWDEGFHQLLIWRWDIDICLDILAHWLDLINIEGWIPREQILGAEARSKVPEEFIVQHPSHGNPPTLFLVLRDLLEAVEKDKFTATESSQIYAFLDRAYVRLEGWFEWFNRTQKGKDSGNYYWHGRDNRTVRELNPKTLTSGLDDYPRASHPSEEEHHLDLRCWLLLAANCMHSIAKFLGSKDNALKIYSSISKDLSSFEHLNEMHLDKASGAYHDFGMHTEKVSLRWRETKEPSSSYVQRELVRVVSGEPDLMLVPHVGYVSLFPLMMKMIPPASMVLEKQLDLISNRSILWTDYGLRSLAKTSSIYMKRNTEHDPPYWRGPIWINMNYMILSALHHYSQESGPYQKRAEDIYKQLRENLIRNIVRNYYESGYLWEQYDQRNGKGKGAHPFTGWTALYLLIVAEVY